MASLKADEMTLRLVEEGFECPDGLVAVAIHEDFARSGEAGLVILAMGDAYWTFIHNEAYVLCVNELRAQAIIAELEAYASLGFKKVESSGSRYHDFQFGWISFALYLLLLITIFSLQKSFDLVVLGRADSLGIIDLNEWWRALTALTLHADAVHLASNLVAGLGFAFFLARFFGAAACWLLILLSGVAGNLLNAWVYFPEAHFSIGASTAVFGALGLLTGIGVCAALTEPQQRWTLPRWLVPVFGGLTLLGLIGVGDGLVDVAAHISGFACGFVLGLIGAFFQPVFQRLQRARWWMASIIFGIVGLAWRLALSAA
ncbi:MAG: rhomboid family intramembrane serine protease [Lentimonas sp.]